MSDSRIKKTTYRSQVLRMDFEEEIYTGETFGDTEVKLEGKFWVSGMEKEKFSSELKALIEKYRI